MPIPTIKENLEEGSTLFLTLKTNGGLPIFTNKKYFNIILQALKWYRKYKKIKIYAYTILINHLHLVIDFLNVNNGEKVLGDFKRYTANQIIKELKKDKQYNILDELYRLSFKIDKQNIKFWRRNNWPEVITSDKLLNQKVDYTDYNATHHGIVEDIENYLYTSYHNHYCNHEVLLEIDEIEF